MIVFHDPSHRFHDPTEPHVFGGRSLPPAEVADRADRILGGLAAASPFEVLLPEPMPPTALAEVHTPDYLQFLETAHARSMTETGAGLDAEAVPYIRPLPGTPWREPASVLAQMGRYSNDVDPILTGTWRAAVAAASCAWAAAGVVASGEPVSYALSRPPGHHAGPETYGGYCYLNNTAIAVTRLASGGGRVAVLDVDTHHGNGTQAVFWERPDVLTLSIHGDTVEHYPYFLGHAGETGGAGAEGTNANFPLATASKWPDYAAALREALGRVVAHGTDRLVVALGVDTHIAHGVLALEGDDFRRLGATIAGSDLPTVFVQEGGYERGTLEDAVPAVLLGFLDG